MQRLWQEPDEDVRSLKSFVLFSLRGMAAYNYHARVLGRIDPDLDRFFCRALQAIGTDGLSLDDWWQLVQETGEASFRCMELLDHANTGAFGDPEPVQVPLAIEKGPFIVISGHDLYDAQQLLEQTKDKGVNIYTHSEMLPAHGYPELKKKYPHLKGNFGTAWQNQQREFEDIPAPILFTTNCIMPLRASYADRVFTTSVVSYPGVQHIDEGRDFTPVIEKALELGGYQEDTLLPGMNGGSVVTTGFARHAVLEHAGEIVQAVKSGQWPVCPASWTSVSATTPTAPCASRWRWPMPLTARSTTCRSRWCCAGSSRKPYASSLHCWRWASGISGSALPCPLSFLRMWCARCRKNTL